MLCTASSSPTTNTNLDIMSISSHSGPRSSSSVPSFSLTASSRAMSYPPRACSLIHLLSLASRIFIDVVLAIIFPPNPKPTRSSDPTLVAEFTAFIKANMTLPTARAIIVALRQLLSASLMQSVHQATLTDMPFNVRTFAQRVLLCPALSCSTITLVTHHL